MRMASVVAKGGRCPWPTVLPDEDYPMSLAGAKVDASLPLRYLFSDARCGLIRGRGYGDDHGGLAGVVAGVEVSHPLIPRLSYLGMIARTSLIRCLANSAS
jgi:hypothetical protein